MVRGFGGRVHVAALVALAAACSAHPLDAGGIGGTGPGTGGTGGGGSGGTFVPTRKVDMLFVIDDASFMTGMQQNLARNFPSLLNRLMDPPGLPDLHVAVISTDMGANDGISDCDLAGSKRGAFQFGDIVPTVTTPCNTGLDPGATFISDGGGVKNYTGDIGDVLGCMVSFGESGCGFEQPLAAVTRALGADGKAPPPENAGFLRPDAYLFIFVLTDRDDCSAPPGSVLFDPAEGSYGPLGHFRCNEAGHLCSGAKPPLLPPTGNVDEVLTLDDCVAAEGAGALIPVADVVAQLRSVKPFPDRQLVVSVIAGPTRPYTMHWQLRQGDTTPSAHINPSCTSAVPSSPAPAVRLQSLVERLGTKASFLSACDSDYWPALDKLGQLLNPPR